MRIVVVVVPRDIPMERDGKMRIYPGARVWTPRGEERERERERENKAVT